MHACQFIHWSVYYTANGHRVTWNGQIHRHTITFLYAMQHAHKQAHIIIPMPLLRYCPLPVLPTIKGKQTMPYNDNTQPATTKSTYWNRWCNRYGWDATLFAPFHRYMYVLCVCAVLARVRNASTMYRAIENRTGERRSIHRNTCNATLTLTLLRNIPSTEWRIYTHTYSYRNL